MKKLASRVTATLKRRSFIRSAAGFGFCAAMPALNLLAGPASAATWRGFIGCIKPRARGSSLADMVRLLPSGIDVAAVYLNLAEGTREEMQRSYDTYERNVDYLASQRCDVISIEGAPPFMLLGPDGEAKMVEGWRQKYKTDMFTSSQNQVNVIRVMKLRKILGITPFGADLNRSYAKYFEDSGVGVAAMEGMDISFGSIPDAQREIMYTFIKKKFLDHSAADGIYILGSGWDTLSIVAALEQDLGVPVVHHLPAQAWEIQKRLHVNQPKQGLGRLLREMP